MCLLKTVELHARTSLAICLRRQRSVADGISTAAAAAGESGSATAVRSHQRKQLSGGCGGAEDERRIAERSKATHVTRCDVRYISGRGTR